MPDPIVPEAPAAPVVPAAAAPVAPSAPAPAESVDQLPAWAQKIITDARSGEANYRTKAQTAAEQATKDLVDKLAITLGLKEDAAADPAALTASLTAAQAKAQESERKLAIFQAAAATGADPSRLLDSNSFMSSIQGLDPSNGAAINAAITAAIAANPILKAIQAAAASGTELGGSGEQGQITDAQLAQMTPEQITKAFNEGKLAHLLA